MEKRVFYKVVRPVQTEKGTEFLSARISHYADNQLLKYKRRYSTHTPAKNGFVFETLEQAKDFASSIEEVWKCTVKWSRKIRIIAAITEGVYKWRVNEKFIDLSIRYGSDELFKDAPTGTHYATQILLIEKVKK